MQAVTYDREESTPQRRLLFQIATTLFLGIPMTLALAIALTVYCTYECIKYALLDKQKTDRIPKQGGRNMPVQVSAEQTFTAALTQFAAIHAETPRVEISGQNGSDSTTVNHEEKTSVPASPKKEC